VLPTSTAAKPGVRANEPVAPSDATAWHCENSDVPPLESVEVAVTSEPIGSAVVKVAVKLRCPREKFETLPEPTNYSPSPEPEPSHTWSETTRC